MRGSGFTLLELLLALSLTVVVLMLVNMAVELHLRSLDARRMQMEESQLARSILRMIADDLRGAVQHYKQDMSGIETLLQQSVSSAAEQVGGALSEATVMRPVDSTELVEGREIFSVPLPASSEGASAQFAAPSAASTTRSASGGSTMSSTSGSPGTSTGESTSQNTEDLSVGTIPPIPGLFGNQYQLQVDVSRLPRVEEYQRYLTGEEATEVVDIPSDVKTVTYFVQSTPTAAGLGASQPLQDLTDPSAQGVGLVRRVLDRSVTLWAMNNGNYTGLENSGALVAPEVAAIEFQYFDGLEWLPEWDTEVQQKLPNAVLVILALWPPGATPSQEVPATSLTTEAGTLRLYRMLVHLPAGGQPPENSAADMGSSSETASTTTDGGTP